MYPAVRIIAKTVLIRLLGILNTAVNILKKQKKKYEGRSIAGFNELNVGDYVVHEMHGLGALIYSKPPYRQ